MRKIFLVIGMAMALAGCTVFHQNAKALQTVKVFCSSTVTLQNNKVAKIHVDGCLPAAPMDPAMQARKPIRPKGIITIA